MTAMDITIHASFLPHDPDASLAFYRDTQPDPHPGAALNRPEEVLRNG